MRIWGVTGTNGKTSCVWILSEFIRADPARRCGYITTVEVDTLSRKFYTGYTTPPTATLKEIFSEMESNGATDCVMEVSSHAIAQHRTGDTFFSGGIFTNLSEDHLDYHKTMEEYFRVKFAFAEQIARDWRERRGWTSSVPGDAGRADFAPYVVCVDGGYGREMLAACGALALNVLPVSSADAKFDLADLALVGDYNRSNVLSAAALAQASGVAHDAIQAAIGRLRPRWGRLEPVENSTVQSRVYVDFAHTPDGLLKVLTAARAFTEERLWVVFGAGGDRDPMKRPLMGQAAANIADKVVVTSDNPRSEEPEAIIGDILGGISDRGKVTVEPDRKKAIEFALKNSRAGDVVIIAGKGHETTQEIKGRKYPFDDRQIVREMRIASAGI